MSECKRTRLCCWDFGNCREKKTYLGTVSKPWPMPQARNQFIQILRNQVSIRWKIEPNLELIEIYILIIEPIDINKYNGVKIS